MSRGIWLYMGARTRRSLTLLWTALFLFSLVLQYVQFAAPPSALAVHTDDVFELDGNTADSAGGGDDWSTIAATGGSAFESIFVTDSINGAPDTWFTGGDTKDIADVSEWLWTDGPGQPQDKNDIEHAFAAAYEVGGDLVVYFGLDRFASNGAAQVGFWFVQDAVGVGPEPEFIGEHRDGDVLVQIDFEEGGTDPILRVYTWVGDGAAGHLSEELEDITASCEVTPGGDTQCAVSNTESNNPPDGDLDPPWTFDDKFQNGTDNVIPAGGFVEGGINLTDLGLDDSCFASFIAETRSSPSEDSTLTDFALGQFSLCAPPVIATSASTASINVGESVTDTATLSGDKGPVTGTVDFYLCGPAASAPTCSDATPNNGTPGVKVGATKTIVGGQAISDAFTPTSPSQVGWYCWRAEYTPAAGSKYLIAEHTNTTTECFQVIPAQVTIVKTTSTGTVSAGSPISFTLSWGNSGPGSAFGVVVSDNLPSSNGLSWSISGSTGSGSTCSEDANVLTCNVGTIPGSTPVHGTVTLTSATTSANCGVIPNTGRITSTNDGTAESTANVTVDCPDVTVVKTPDGGSVQASQTAVFSVTVSNLGPGTATDVTLNDPLDAGLDWTLGAISGDTAGVACQISGSVGSEVLSCTDTSMAPGDDFTVSVSAPTDFGDCGPIPNLATVDAANEPNTTPYTSNNTDPGDISVRCAQIDIEKTADPAGPVDADDEIGFDIVVTNTGDGTAFNVLVSDPLPGGPPSNWSIAGGYPQGDTTGLACQITGARGAQSLSCTDAEMLPGESFTVRIVSKTTGAMCGVIDNTATVTTTNDGTDSDGASVTILCPDVTVTKVADDDSVSAGDEIGFTIEISNLGPGEAHSAFASDPLPGSGWSIESQDGGWSLDGNSLSFEGDLAAGASSAVHVVRLTTADDCGNVPNTVTVGAGNEDEDDTDDNEASADVDVLCPDVTVTKVADDEVVNAGDEIGFTVTISNAGPGAAHDAFANDTLPGGGWSIESQDGGWTLAGNDLTFSGDLMAGESRSVHVVRLSSPDDCGTVPNTVTVGAANEPEDDELPNSASDSTEVECPDVTVDKSAAVTPISAGEVASFVIEVWNDGPGTAYDVTLTDTLPAGVAWVVDGTDPAGIPCQIDGSALTCQLGDLEPEGEGEENHVFIYLSGETSITGCGEGDFELLNTVVVAASNEAQEDTADNSDDATIVVQCPELGIGKDADHADPVSAGNPIGFTVTLANFGAGTAFDVRVDDLLPAGFDWVIESQDGGWSLDEQADGLHLVWGPDDLEPGSSAVHVVSDTDLDDCGLVPNAATVFMDEDEIGSDDAAEEILCPDIDIDKTSADEDGVVGAGQTVSYTIEVFVLDADVPGGVVTDTLPVGQTYVDGSASSVPAATSFEVSADGRTLTWTYDFVLRGDPAATIGYDVTIDPGTPTGELTNTAEFCVAIGADVICDDDDETVRVPELVIEKSVAGNSGGTTGGGTPIAIVGDTLTYTLDYTLTNGPVTAGVISDVIPVGLAYVDGSAADNAEFSFTSATANGDGTTTLRWDAATVTAAGSLTYDVEVLAAAARDTDLINVATIDSAETPPDDDEQPITVPPTPVYGLGIDKTNDAPIDTIDLGDGVTVDLPTAAEGDTVTFTLTYTLAADPVSDAVITDVLPVGIDYVSGSATSNAEFSFAGYDPATRTLRWTAPSVTAGGSLSYDGLVADGAVDLAQPLVNVATIDSAETEPDSDDSQVFVQEEAGVVITPPPTDTFDTRQAAGNPGFALMLALLLLAGLALGVGFVTPVPERVRRRDRRG